MVFFVRLEHMEFSESLRKNRDFQQIYRRGTSQANRELVMIVCENSLGKNRVGISVSKKVGNSVVRHRLTRLIREGYRLQETRFKKGLDIVFIARVNARDCAYKEIERAIHHLAEKHRVLEEESEA